MRPLVLRGDPPELVAAIDLGSNSFHMIVGRLMNGQLKVVDRLREPVRFAAGLDAERCISGEAMDRALDCLRRFGQRVADMPVGSVRAVGTNTLRQARNGRVFRERARAALGHPVEIISGQEEARLIYLGVAQTMPDAAGRRLVVDIGGGSTEHIIGEGFDIVEADSLYMGCVSYSLRFFPDGVLTKERFRQARLAAAYELESLVRRYRRVGWSAAVGCSGTVHAIDGILRANGWSPRGITLKGLRKLRKELIERGRVDALEIAGLAPERRGVIAGGAAILEQVFRDLEIEVMHPSAGALREGALYDLVGRIQHEDVRDRTIRWFCEHYDVEMDQAARVEATALTLLDQVAGDWELDLAWARQLVSWAAHLCEIGLAIGHTGYHKHSAYIVAHGHMPGFSRQDQAVLAAVVRGHRRKLREEIFAGVDPVVRTEVVRICLLFRLAWRLHRSRSTADLDPGLTVQNGTELLLTFPPGWLADHPLTETVLGMEADYVRALGYTLLISS